MKSTLLIILLALTHNVYAQECQLYNSLNIVSTVAGSPDHMIKLGYDISPTNNLSYYFELAGDWSAINKLNYRNYSLSLGPRYYVLGGNNQLEPQRVNLLAGLIGILQYENETTLYKGMAFTKHLNYGAGFHVLGEYTCSETIGIMGGIEQRVFFTSELANPNMNFFMGLRIHFVNKH